MQDMEADDDLFPFFLWVDTDRSGSDNLITKFAWPAHSKKGPIRISPSAAKDTESRFVQLDESQLRSAIDKLGTHLRQSGVKRESAKAKYQQLRAMFMRENAGTLSEFNLRLSEFLLDNCFNYNPYPVVLSDVLNKGMITDEVNLFVNHVDDIVKVFNAAIQSLKQEEVDPQLTALAENYLPLFFSCELDDRRLRLHQYIDGNDHFAVGTCKCGQGYKFYLGNTSLDVSELTQTDRWSPDVCFPMFVNNLVSGFVAGKSSAIYLIVMAEVLRKVLNKRPVPVLVPESLGRPPSGDAQPDSLLYSYMSA